MKTNKQKKGPKHSGPFLLLYFYYIGLSGTNVPSGCYWCKKG